MKVGLELDLTATVKIGNITLCKIFQVKRVYLFDGMIEFNRLNRIRPFISSIKHGRVFEYIEN